MNDASLLADRAAAQRSALLSDALAGLGEGRKSLPCKWLYDAEGARLFEAIMRLPEYYPTRTEIRILEDCAAEVAIAAGPRASVVEFGSGTAEKVSILLDALAAPAAYAPVDIAPEWLFDAAARIARERPGLRVLPVLADFTSSFALPPSLPDGGPRLGFFPGSTIGNFTADAAERFLASARETLGPGACLLIGVDLVKDPARLLAAYDDPAGVTARFNLNLLARLNRECGADFDVGSFRHRAVWNPRAERIEMHLESMRSQEVRLGQERIRFARGERVHTEDSHKYRPERFAQLARRAGWEDERCWTDAEGLFSVWLLRSGSSPPHRAWPKGKSHVPDALQG